MANIETGFPKNLAYNLKELAGGFNKQKVKILGDLQSVSASGIVRFKLPSNTIVDLRSLVLYFTGATAGTGSTTSYIHFPRYTSSLLQRITISANNITLCSINEYGLLYNSLMDMEGADSSQYSKRIGELFDPTIRWSQTTSAGTTATNENAIAGVINHSVTGSTSNDSNVNMCINNWLGFLGSCSTPCIDTTDFSDIFIEFAFASTNVLYHSTITTSAPTISSLNYTLSTIFITLDLITFGSALYYNLKTEKLIGDGLAIGYYDYWTSKFTAITKSSGVAVNFNLNSACLDQLIATFQNSDVNSGIRPLVLYGGNAISTGTVVAFPKILGDPLTYVNCEGTFGTNHFENYAQGDAFAQSYYFRRAGNDLISSQWTINSKAIDNYALTPLEIFNKDLQYMGYNNIDMGSSGLHAGILSLYHWLKYYFIDICDLTNLAGDNAFWIAGLNSAGSSINIQYNATFASTNGASIIPVIFARSSKKLIIKSEKQLEII